jgi:hypothetical protein
MSKRVVWFSIIALVGLTACSNISDGSFEDGPRLIREVTVEPITPQPTLPLTSTPAPTQPTLVSVVLTPTDGELDMVTPTLPPTKTPTLTPTLTQTPRFTPTPFVPTSEPQAQVEQDPILVPTFVFDDPPTAVAFAPQPSAISPVGDLSIPAPGLVPAQPQAACSNAQWFFFNPPLPDCPPGPPLVTEGSFQPFEDGFMIWVGAQDAIYVLFISADTPRWQVFPDTYTDGVPEYDPAMNAGISPYSAWQPRRGFGLIWRTYPDIRERIGWAKSEWEAAYTIQVQTAADGTIYISEPAPRSGVFQLRPNGSDWDRYR